MRMAAKTFFVIAVLGLSLAGISQAMTEEENAKLQEDMKDYKFKPVTTKEGLHFSIPEDMPIEKRNGITAPIPFEEYLYFKFKKIEEKMTALDKKIDDDFDRIDKKIDALSESVASMKKKEKADLPSSS